MTVWFIGNEDNMENEIQYIKEQLKQQEDKYCEKVRSLIDFASLTEQQRERADTELKLIHMAGYSKRLYMAYCMARKLREDNKCFSVRLCAGDSYVCYLLGITKVSPYDPRLAYVLPYQPFLGIEGRPKYWNLDFNIPEFYRETLINHIRAEFEGDTEFFEGVNPSGKVIRGLMICSFKGFSETELFAENSDIKQRIKYNNSVLHGYVSTTTLPATFPCTLNSEMRTLVTGRVDENAGFEALNKNRDDKYLFTNRHNMHIPTDSFWQYCLGCTEVHNTREKDFKEIMICREDVWMRLQKLNTDEQTRYDIFDKIRKGMADRIADKWTSLFEEAGEGEFLEAMKRYLYICPIAHSIENVENAIELAWYRQNYPEQFSCAVKQIFGRGFVAVNTGFKEIDDMIQGIRMGNLMTVAERCEVDRTALLINMAMNEAGQGNNVGILSLDLSEEMLKARILERITGIEYDRILNKKDLKPEELHKIDNAKYSPSYINIKIDGNGPISIKELGNKIKTLQQRYGLGFVIIDYYQLIKEAENADRPVPMVLKTLARELDIAIVVTVRLKRDFDRRNPFYGLAKSGFEAGEEDSDKVIFLEKETASNSENNGRVVADIRKNRNIGRCGKVRISMSERDSGDEQ